MPHRPPEPLGVLGRGHHCPKILGVCSLDVGSPILAVPGRQRLGVHCVVVVFDPWHLGTRWTGRFMPSELEPA